MLGGRTNRKGQTNNEKLNFICKGYYIKVERLIKTIYEIKYQIIYNIRQTAAMNIIPQ